VTGAIRAASVLHYRKPVCIQENDMTNDPGSAADRPWGPGKRILFRFAFCYLLLCTTTYLLYFLPLPDLLFEAGTGFWNAVVPRVGSAVFHADTSVLPNGSGDTTYNYVQVFCFLLFALVAAAVWTLLDRGERRDARLRRLDAGLRLYLRFALAFWMFQYGAVKVVPLQGGGLPLDRLLQPFGDASREGLFWTFMGASAGYKMFSGACEMLGGLLLVFRRTALLGALVCAGVLTHVVVLNLCYDVPVKLFSSHLLVLAVFLALPDLGRLADLLVFNRRVEPAPIRLSSSRPWRRWAGLALRTAFVLLFAVLPLVQAREAWQRMRSSPKPPLYGVWNVEELVRDGEALPPLLTDATRWQRVVFDDPRTMAILTAGSRERYLLDLDPGAHRLKLSRLNDPRWASVFTFERPEPRLLTLDGTIEGHRIQARLRQVDPPEFRLVSRGVHLINEYPDPH
jgi:hypothetical protein